MVCLLTSIHPEGRRSAGSEVTRAIIRHLQAYGFAVNHVQVAARPSRLAAYLPWFVRTTFDALWPGVTPCLVDPQHGPIIAFESEGMRAALDVARTRKCLIIVPDLPAARVRYTLAGNRATASSVKANLTSLLESHLMRRIFRRAPLADFAVYGSQHKADIENRFAIPVVDLRPQLDITPTVDDALLESSQARPLRLVFGGSLTGTASRLAAIDLAGVLSGNTEMQLTVAGMGAVDFACYLPERSTRVEIVENPPDFEKVLARSDVFLMLGDYPVGVRTRILSALAAGNIVIAHEAVYSGMPELRNCASLFAYFSVSQVPAILARIESGPRAELRRTSVRFWSENYTLERTMTPIIQWLRSQ
jgi:hypothetical protein